MLDSHGRRRGLLAFASESCGESVVGKQSRKVWRTFKSLLQECWIDI